MLVWSLSHRSCPSSVTQWGPFPQGGCRQKQWESLLPAGLPGSMLPGITGKLLLTLPTPVKPDWGLLAAGASTVNLLTQAFTKEKESKDDLAASRPQNQFHSSSPWERFCKLALQSHHIQALVNHSGKHTKIPLAPYSPKITFFPFVQWKEIKDGNKLSQVIIRGNEEKNFLQKENLNNRDC